MAWLLVWLLFLTAWLPCFPVLKSHGAVHFGELNYEKELVEQWDTLAARAGMQRTDLQNHYTSTYPEPKVIASVKQQTGFSPGGQWKELEYRNVYCISHNEEAANNPVSSMICSSAWYVKEPWTLQNLPDYMRLHAGADEYRLRFNFLMLAYGADYHAYQDGVNSDSIIGTADYYLCQGICTLTEEAQFTGDYDADWALYESVVMDWASRFHPNGMGDDRVWRDMKTNAKNVFETVWHTAKLMAFCTQSNDEGFTFYPTIIRESDGMYHAKFPLTEETRQILSVSEIQVTGDWHYNFTAEALDFYSETGLISNDYIARIDPSNANGIIASSIGAESVRELHQPVMVHGRWSLTYSQANLVSVLLPGTCIVIGTEAGGGVSEVPSFTSSGGVARYRHSEKWQADYIVNLRKLDAETGKPLADAQFDILEAFDDSQLEGSILEDDNWDNAGGSQFLRWEGWDALYGEGDVDPCTKDQEITDEDGYLTGMESAGAGPLFSNGIRAHHDVKYYSYTKGYCGGHPEPDEEDEEEMDEYEREIAVCENLERQGGFYHSLSGGAEALKADRDAHYKAFVSLTYDYSARELTSRNGYILHNQEPIHEPHENRYDGIHEDTIPIETVTVHPSQYYGMQKKLSEESVSELILSSNGKEPEENKAETATVSDWEFDPYILDEDAWMLENASQSDATMANAEVSMTAVSTATTSDAGMVLPGAVISLEWYIHLETPSNTARFALTSTNEFRDNSDRFSLRSSGIKPIGAGNTDYNGMGADWTFEVYNHRTEGEIHANKRDLDLKTGELDHYDSYADTQGDGTLQGAVYGLFAAEDILHPDGKTGVVYEKGNLTSIAVTDENGDFSFLTYTEKPGVRYDYNMEAVVETGFSGPGNLYETGWIGRPLILGAYYIQELKRSEGYELSVYGIEAEITNRYAWNSGGKTDAQGTVSVSSIEEQVIADSKTGYPDIVTLVTLESQDVMQGYDIQMRGIDPAAGPVFYTAVKGEKDIFSEWQEPVIHYEPVEADAGMKVLIDGAYIPAEMGDEIELPNGELVEAVQTVVEPVNSAQLVLTGSHGSIPAFDVRYIPELSGIQTEDPDELAQLCNQAFAEIGLQDPGREAPYVRIELGEDLDKWPSEIYGYLSDESCPSWNAARLETIIHEDGTAYAILRYAFLNEDEILPVVYSVSDDAFYVKYDVYYDDLSGYLYRKYPASELEDGDYELGNRLYRWIQIDREKPEKERLELYEDLEKLEFISAQDFVSYWAYAPGDYLRAEDGTIYQKERISYEKKSGYHVVETLLETPVSFEYDLEREVYCIHIAPEQIPADDALIITIHYEDIFAGNRTGLSISAFPSMITSGTYVEPVQLIYPGQMIVYEDAATRRNPITVLQRIIREKVKVNKTLEQEINGTVNADAWHGDINQVPADGFRFKIYLKSNLKRLYRNENGEILWMDRDEQELSEEEIRKHLAVYPEKAPQIFTRQFPESNYIPMLEQDENGYGYAKFFDAIAVANHDVWDDANAASTSSRPVGNHPNRTEYTLKNIIYSDAVRQFAIDWYLDEAAETCKVESSFSDELYDWSLNQALHLAADYLRPFFAYDLDEIYAISWDSEAEGGDDQDETTLSAEQRSDEGYCAVSGYLPYGDYVVVEQQPRYAYPGDLKNRHYQIETPKEISIPAGEEPERIPWSIIDPGTGFIGDTEDSWRGFSSIHFHNQQYKAHLRIEKLDAATHENLLHDSAVFHIYKAQRSEALEGKGEVLFYEKPTMIQGSKEFLESMKAEHIQPMSRIGTIRQSTEVVQTGPGVFYTGIVKAGTPVCYESDRIVQKDEQGINLDAFSTARKGRDNTEPALQNVGYLETPEPLKAGVYVICEAVPPEGYVRTDPVAVEVYSDTVSYYQHGHSDCRILAAIYENETGGGLQDEARIYIENSPITLAVEKKKEASDFDMEKTITYVISGRIEGDLSLIGNNPDYVYAYHNGEYLGYAWEKGTLEYLQARQAAGEQVEIVYEGKNFAGYGYVTRTLETADDMNSYVTGALMTLYQAVRLKPSGDTQDFAYHGLSIERNNLNEVVRMYLKETEQDILFYDLDSLMIRKTEHSAIAYRGGIPYLEFVGGDFSHILYDRKDRHLSVGTGTRIYHLDRNGNRDSLVEAYTGMAYLESDSEDVYVWPVRVFKDSDGNILSRDKIRTYRAATAGENQGNKTSASDGERDIESGYLTGSWNDEYGTESHNQITLEQNAEKQNMQDEAVTDASNGIFEKYMSPVYDEHGLVIWYQRGDGHYERETELYDRNGDAVRLYESEALEEYRSAAYEITSEDIQHRLGESYVMENTWISSDRTPNDPFQTELTEGQKDLIKRIPCGEYILEELLAPNGYQKGFPIGITVQEQEKVHEAMMTDATTKLEISKLDSTKSYVKRIRDMTSQAQNGGTLRTGLGEYSHDYVEGAILVLYEAERVYTTDFKQYPKGYYLKRKGQTPLRYFSTNSLDSKPDLLEAKWITGNASIYLEGIPKGIYMLEELEVPEGFIRSQPAEVLISESKQVQTIAMCNDHTRIEVEKYAVENGEKRQISGAEFALYITDLGTEKGRIVHQWTSNNCEIYRDFIPEFEQMYRDYGVAEGTAIRWKSSGNDYYARFVSAQVSETGTKHPNSAIMEFLTSEGQIIRITVYEKKESRQGSDFVYEYQFDYQKLSQINEYACAWVTLDGVYRLEYLPVGGHFLLQERKAPKGYLKAEDTMLYVTDTADIQRYSIQNHLENPDMPAPDESEAPKEPEIPDESETPKEPEIPEESESPQVPGLPDESVPSKEPEIPETPEVPKEPELSGDPEFPDAPEIPEESGSSNDPDAPSNLAPEFPVVIPQIDPFPEIYQRIGYISASYHPSGVRHWYSDDDYNFTWLKFLPYLGDRSDTVCLLWLFIISILGILFCRKKRK